MPYYCYYVHMKDSIKHFTIKDSGNDVRLDIFLTNELKVSRGQIQKLIKNEHCQVDDIICTSPHLKLKKGQKIVFDNQPKEIIKRITYDLKIEPEILLETKDYLVINKPTGLIVHPAENNPQATLVDWLLIKYPTIKKVGENPLRPGIIHRLDRDVSGAMLVALNQKTYTYFKKQFQDHKIQKTYSALVHGNVSDNENILTFPLVRSKKTGHIVAWPNGSEHGRQAETHIEVIKRYQQTTLINCYPITGRTHQIRVHCKAFGHPIVGDPVYGQKKSSLSPGRIFLHSINIEFIDNNKEKVVVRCPLPKILKNFLLTLS